MPLRLTPAVKAGADGPPTCEHGRWQFAGSDYKRKAAKWRCPTKECKPGPGGSKQAASTPSSRATATACASSTEDVPPLNASSAGWKHEWSPLTIRVRGIERVRLHADLTILAKLACALARARAVPLTACQ